MRVAIVGVGGAGGYFGARLAEAGEDVTFVARGAHLAQIREHGLRVDSPLGDMHVSPARAVEDVREVGTVDYVLLGVKSWQVPDAARMLAPLLGPDTAVVPLQNGMDAVDQIADAVGPEHTLGGLAKIISVLAGPGHIEHVSMEPILAFGELTASPSARVERLREAFARTKGVHVTCPPNILTSMWEKFMFMVGWGAIGAVTRAPLGVILRFPETRRMLLGVMEEIERVAEARGIQISPLAERMPYIDSLPAAGTSSLQRDLMDGLPSELESLSGAAVRLGAKAGVATPINTFLYHALLPLEARARGTLTF